MNCPVFIAVTGTFAKVDAVAVDALPFDAKAIKNILPKVICVGESALYLSVKAFRNFNPTFFDVGICCPLN